MARRGTHEPGLRLALCVRCRCMARRGTHEAEGEVGAVDEDLFEPFLGWICDFTPE